MRRVIPVDPFLYKIKTKKLSLQGHLGKIGVIYYIKRGSGKTLCICEQVQSVDVLMSLRSLPIAITVTLNHQGR